MEVIFLGILAILGRGIQRSSSDGTWVPTEDLELCDKDGSHLAVYKPPDDNSPYCMVGGSELNVLAGIELYKNEGAKIVVCAYGDRSKYLTTINGPSESMVLSEMFKKVYPNATVNVWTKEMTAEASNTNRELQNIFELANNRGESTVGIVTINLHMPRAMVMTQRHLAKTEFRHLSVRFYVSEQVLVEKDPAYGPRCEALRHSKSFTRNWEREQTGILMVLNT